MIGEGDFEYISAGEDVKERGARLSTEQYSGGEDQVTCHVTPKKEFSVFTELCK